jgi:YD repeat-containing protein
VTPYAYTPTGGGPPANLLSQIFYPSNPTLPFVSNTYDTLGRVATQTNANGATWNYFFAGYRSEEDDAYGTSHVIYYNPRGKPVFDIQDAAGLNRVTATVYDGLDRLSTVTQPEGGSTAVS